MSIDIRRPRLEAIAFKASGGTCVLPGRSTPSAPNGRSLP